MHEDHFGVDNFFNYSDCEAAIAAEEADVAPSDGVPGDSSAANSCNSVSSEEHRSSTDTRDFFNVPCVPITTLFLDLTAKTDRREPAVHQRDDLAPPPLELTSKIEEEESYSRKEIQYLHIISGFNTRPESDSFTLDPDPDHHYPAVSITDVVSDWPRTAVSDWLSSDTPFTSRTSVPDSIIENHALPPLPPLPSPSRPSLPPPFSLPWQSNESCSGRGTRKKNFNSASSSDSEGSNDGFGRRCRHCDTNKTPQWRTGPEGPKTLCNACGVRYKSGRLVPEYRPAASPTFVLAEHSNSHRKVMELRRQKQITRAQQECDMLPNHQMDGANFDLLTDDDDFLIHKLFEPDFFEMN